MKNVSISTRRLSSERGSLPTDIKQLPRQMNAAARARREKLALVDAGQVGFGLLGTRDDLVKKTVAKEEGRYGDAYQEGGRRRE